MNQAIQDYIVYTSFIKEIKEERRKMLLSAVHNSVTSTVNKVGTFSKNKIDNFKKNVSKIIKDIDLNVQNKASVVQERAILAQVKLIEKKQRFKNNIVQKVNKSKDKIVSIKKEKIPQFKKKIANSLKDVDLKIQNTVSHIQERAILSQVKFIEKKQRFKNNVVQKVNNTKNAIGRIARAQKEKLKNVFVSDELTRQNKLNEINERRKKIEELKKYRNELLNVGKQQNEQPMVGRSRGNLYIWMAAFASVLLMTIMIIIAAVKR